MISKFIQSLTSFMLVVVILICPMSNLNAAIGVGGIKTLGVNTAGATSDPFLSSSRYRGGINGDTLIFHIAQFGRNQPAWFYSYDRGVTWDSAVTMLDNVYSLWYMDYHSNGWYSGNSGFHTAWRYRTSANRPLYRHISAPYTAESMTEPVRQLGLPTDISYYSVVCANDSEQFFLNLMANVETPLIVYHSTDNFETYTRTEPRNFRVTSGGTTQNGMRANIQMGDDGRPTITVLDVGTHAFYRLKWDGTIWDSTMITNNISGLSERGYAYSEMNGKGHLVYMRDSDNKWFHCWESGGTTWAVDSSLSVVNWTGLGAQQLSVINSGANARLYLFYMVEAGIEKSIVLKTWTELDGWDADSTVIVKGAQCTWPQCPPYVPADYDSVAVIWKSSATNLVYEINVEAIAAELGNTIPPNQITDLYVVSTNDSSITLSWTTPGADVAIGTATQYDLRYSLSPITSDNWNFALQVVGEPTPLLAGTNQSFTVLNLNQVTTYYFAITAVDESGNWSSISNVTSSTTLSDITPPAQIIDLLSATGITDSTIDLSWTAPGDDNLSGTGTTYIIKYSTEPITNINWVLASSVVDVISPLSAGTEQTITVSGLDLSTTYYFAMMTGDEADNWSIMSNVSSAVTTSDVTPPAQILNLSSVVGAEIGSVNLAWTAPGDDKNIGTASLYDLRYSISPITVENWNLAVQYDVEPLPLPVGSNQSFTVTELELGTIYYFAMMTADESENLSLISNITNTTTSTEITPPSQIINLSAITGTEYGIINLEWTAPGDDQNIGTASQYDLRFSIFPITTDSWDLAQQIDGEPSPLLAGTNQTLTVSGLNLGTTYYFAMMTADESDNWSVMSNVASATTTSDITPPAQITDLISGTGVDNGTVSLTWTAPGDDSLNGTASTYVIKYSPNPITYLNWDLATIYYSPLNPLPAGSTENLTLSGLNPGDLYYFAIQSIDDATNESIISNISSAQAYLFVQPTVSIPLAVGYTTAGHALLGSPSYRGGRQGDTLIMVSAQFGSNQTGWTVSYDRGTTWQDIRARWMSTYSGFQTWYSSDHSAAWFAGGLHLSFRGYASTDPAGYRYIVSPYASEANMETVDIPAVGTDTYNPIVVANSADDVWFFDMSEGTSRNNLRYWHSIDRFATPVIPGRVCNISEDPQNNWRMGVIIGANGYPKVSVFKFNGGYSIWSYNPNTQMFDSSLVVANSIGGLGRSYAHAEMNELDHVVYTSGWRGSLVHFYETSEGQFDSTIISASSLNSYDPQLCVYGEGASARLYVAYLNLDSAICVKGWSQSTGWDTDSIIVSGTGHVALEPALIPQVPSSWGFLPIWYHDLNDNNLYFVKLYLSPSTLSQEDYLTGLTTVVSESIVSNDESKNEILNKNAEDENLNGAIPTHFGLSQNYPNPFNPSTTIEYGLPTNSHVQITVFNIQGQKVSTLVNANQPAGNYQVEWNGKDASGVELSSGVYLYYLSADGFFKSMKMILLK